MLGACGGGGESTGAACSDRADNDGDGLVDCADPQCGTYLWCSGAQQDAGSHDAGPGPHDAGPGPHDAAPRPDATFPSCNDPIDVVFTIDVSTSMDDEIAAIRRGIDSIWRATEALSTNARFSLVVFVDDVKAVNDCAPFPTAVAMQEELDRWEEFTRSNEQPGGSGSNNSDCPENSLDAIYTAATGCPWRPGSLRILIHVTDDTFAERPDRLSAGPFGGGGIPVMHTYEETISALVEREIRVGAFAAPNPPEYCGAGYSDDVAQGFFAPYRGMPSIPMATGGQAWSIREVRAGSLDMAEAITEFTAAEYCTLY